MVKGLSLFFTLLTHLWQLQPIDIIVIQNPPSLPVLIAAIMIRWLQMMAILLFLKTSPPTHICIDWHNLGFSIFEQTRGKRHPVVLLCWWLELVTSWAANSHMCVSKEMSCWLRQHFGVDALVLYDRPPAQFRQGAPSAAERHALLSKLHLTERELFGTTTVISRDGVVNESVEDETIQTVIMRVSDKKIIRHRDKSNNIRLLMSATSWTPDEDFDYLIDALKAYDNHCTTMMTMATTIQQHDHAVRPMRAVVAVTGKGPLKQTYEKIFTELNTSLSYVRFVTLWLEPEDYPRFVSCADLGLCFHTSSSGLDLPMKVLDMLGSGVPVCAVRYRTLHELVVDNGNCFVNDV